jgi:hypothetical protein
VIQTSIRNERRANATPIEPTPEDQEALRDLNDSYNPEGAERLAQERQWAINIAFLRGFHYHKYDQTTRTMLFRPMQKRWRVFAVRNHIRAYVERRVATLSGFDPDYIVNPANEDQDSFLIAETGEKLLKYEWRHGELDLLMQDVFYWMEVTGNAFLKTTFNAQSGTAYAEDIPATIDGQPRMTQNVMYEGDLEHEVVPSFAMHTEPYLLTPSHANWLVEERYRPIEWVERNFPEYADYVPMGSPISGTGRGRRGLIDFSSPAGLFAATDNKAIQNYCFVREKWAKPSIDYPKGRLIIAIEDMIVRNGDNPCPDHELPYRWFRSQPVPGTAWADCNVTHMISPQKDLNRLVSQHIEHIVLTGRAKVMEHSTNKLQDGAFRTEIGDTILWNGISEPHYLVPPPMPNDLSEEVLRCSQHFDSITGQYGPARGQYQGKMSGRAIDALVEMDQKSEEPVVKRIAKELERWGSMTLKWMRDYVSSERTVRIVGKSNELSIISFAGADLENATDVTIDIDSVTPKSKTFALTMIQQLAQVGMLNPGNPEDKQRAWKMMAMRTDEQFVKNKIRDQRDATIENRLMLLGIPVEDAQWYQDADSHYMTHTDAMKSDEYKKAPPVVKLWFMKHMESHRILTIPQVGVTLPPEATMSEGTPTGGKKEGGGGGGSQSRGSPQPSGGGFQ